MPMLVIYVVVGTSIWVAVDASRLGVKRGTLDGRLFDMGPVGWFFGVLFLWIIGFPAYLIKRPEYVANRNILSGTQGLPTHPQIDDGLGRGSGNTLVQLNAPGWYPDPSDPSMQRYFNGTEWTDLPAPPPTDRAMSAKPQIGDTDPAVMEDSRTVLSWTVVAGGALVALGSLLAWMTATAGIFSISRNAFQLGDHESMTVDGPIVMVLGLLLIGIGVARLTNTSMPRFVQKSPIIVGLGVALVLGYDYQSIHQWALSLNSSGALGSVGTGYWVCCVGDALAILAGIGLLSSERKAKQVVNV